MLLYRDLDKARRHLVMYRRLAEACEDAAELASPEMLKYLEWAYDAAETAISTLGAQRALETMWVSTPSGWIDAEHSASATASLGQLSTRKARWLASEAASLKVLS